MIYNTVFVKYFVAFYTVNFYDVFHTLLSL